jgi:hypothetical protein
VGNSVNNVKWLQCQGESVKVVQCLQCRSEQRSCSQVSHSFAHSTPLFVALFPVARGREAEKLERKTAHAAPSSATRDKMSELV